MIIIVTKFPKGKLFKQDTRNIRFKISQINSKNYFPSRDLLRRIVPICVRHRGAVIPIENSTFISSAETYDQNVQTVQSSNFPIGL